MYEVGPLTITHFTEKKKKARVQSSAKHTITDTASTH